MLDQRAYNTHTVRLNEDLLSEIDEFMFANKIFKRANAIRRLIESGLKLEKAMKGNSK